ncbi:hypothetical protein EYW49_14130 [Siculibacillus lacustris]|uniref:Glucosamine inositolphosphorylceramide transferase 1 N-terminal domain-containing protein n=1 Tax=Siculibacillus lacustris TaxID=1549641 RepID=A0A4Q9VMD2_9HYPH|nr:hypothetical protein [Siculibacillus lacustris]TBW36472.1 hypothetical protein EYW49_14130 [Siculibacillus lacustris]
MNITVYVPADRSRRWHLRVVTQIARLPGSVVAVIPIGTDRTPPGLDLLFDLERLIGGSRDETAVDLIPLRDFEVFRAGSATVDLVVDLAGADVSSSIRTIRLSCGGLPPLAGAASSAIGEEPPILSAEICDGEGRHVFDSWVIAVEDRCRASASTSMILARAAQLAILATRSAVAATASPRTGLVGDVPAFRAVGSTAVAALAGATLGRRIARRLKRAVTAPQDWRTVWRLRRPRSEADAPETDPTPFHMVADDGRRFYADPFPITVSGRTFLFLEEFPYATGRGLLSVCEIGDDGRPSKFRPILEQNCHLSYPGVFEYGGEIYMVPETTGRRTVELWRSSRFPDQWELHATLLSCFELHDPTIAEIDGGWWMFGTGRDPWCSSWDALHVLRAPSLFGPWVEVDECPTRVDVRSSRPGGRLFRHGGSWHRPVQDSSKGYGSGLAVVGLDLRDGGAPRETVVRRLRPSAPFHGLHTWNRARHERGVFEAMDVLGPRYAPDHPLSLFGEGQPHP